MAELVSTRDPNQEIFPYTYAVKEGLAPDRGLYVLRETPQFSLGELQALQGQPFELISAAVQGKLIGDEVPADDLAVMTAEAYGADKFPGTRNGNIVPIRELGDDLWEQQLYRGPTAAFKDIPLQFLGQVLPYVLDSGSGRGPWANRLFRIIGATSGDTGSAAEDPFKGNPGIEAYIISPANGMTRFQAAQMARLSGGNIHNLRVAGGFDDAQKMVKDIQADPEFSDMGAVNSINVGRIFAQVAYTVSGYLQLMKQTGQEIGQPIDVTIPTGNFGNTYSVYLAKMMGVPIREVVIATNENDLVDRLVQTGEYKAETRVITSSPSMDIGQEASNYERLLSHMVEDDPVRVRQYMEEFSRTGRVSLSSVGLGKTAFARLGIASGSSTHEDRLETIGQIYADSGYVIDPHTADAVTVAARRDRDVPMLVLGTADPVKFEATIREALDGFVPEREERFKGMERHIRPGSFTHIEASVEALKAYIRTHTRQSYDLTAARVATA